MSAYLELLLIEIILIILTAIVFGHLWYHNKMEGKKWTLGAQD